MSLAVVLDESGSGERHFSVSSTVEWDCNDLREEDGDGDTPAAVVVRGLRWS